RVFALTVAVLGIPLCLLGTLFPYLLKISEPYVTNVGGMLGRLAAVNTAGAILGSLLAGFILLPCLGLWKSIHGLAVLYVVLAVALAFMIKSLGRIWRVTALGAALLCSGLLLGTSLPPMLLSPGETMVEYWHGTNGTVAVVDRGNNRQLKVDGHYGLGGTAAAEIERGQTRIPLMLNPQARSIFFLGLGTGITAGEASSSRYGLERIVACELIPEVVTASRKHFSDFTGSLFTDPRCTVMVEDGRNYLQATRETFDVINSDLFIVYRKGAGSLYSLEHFQNVKAHLAPNGIFVLWIPLYQLTKDEFGMIARTMLEVFPQVTAWRNQFITWGDAVALVGQTSESSFFAEGHHGYPLDKRRESWEQQGQALHEYNLLLNYCGNLSRAKKLFSGYPLNTDDRPLIEYSGPISASLQAIDKVAWLAGPKFIALVDEMQACSPPEQDPALSSLPLEQRHAARAGYYLARALLFEDYYKKTHETELVWKQESQKARQQFQMLWLQKE
ncbi:MAG: fused MFS/spermidine synthase, partial [Verrucomicrobia bacterium]|nr:fused MFS/spermidine synthase [Verrucomicrobiota bacterium]